MTISVLMFNGSPRERGNTEICLRRVETGLNAAGIDTEFIRLADFEIHPCEVCMGCQGTRRCAQEDDLNDLIEKMEQANGIIIGSPTWFGSVTGWVKNFIDRAGFVSRMNDHMFYRKVGAPVIAVRRAGAVQVYNEIMSFFAINHFYMVGSSYWNFAFGLEPGEAHQDAEGMRTMDDLAANMAHLLNALAK